MFRPLGRPTALATPTHLTASDVWIWSWTIRMVAPQVRASNWTVAPKQIKSVELLAIHGYTHFLKLSVNNTGHQSGGRNLACFLTILMLFLYETEYSETRVADSSRIPSTEATKSVKISPKQAKICKIFKILSTNKLGYCESASLHHLFARKTVIFLPSSISPPNASRE